MLRTLLLSKIHRATITQTDLQYHGSITIDKNLIEAVGLKPYEKVEIFNVQNGNRFETYVIEGERGSGIIGINGAAARLVHRGDQVIIVNYGIFNEEEAKNHKPKVIILNEKNEIEERVKT
ncbi:MAG: aspartate 1-decarboxylase [Candidatus Cloacimonadales bacterium]|jgi:aspartate 1-decarboxylase|nr:aspartate 1-decarboxylase [Candidatus Cloacimonadota bacterium]MDD2650687.1 aspartate 1-decarboxylase [Candidatus Cloacimonadota bacterium]MDD3501400.1 aspartate 1-decarboxylase [Candidatus Cloacimonadota bacterium]MDX9976944.1 aspartate 1-decarboxylase [Candidatus Cloacimonadales bacterium]